MDDVIRFVECGEVALDFVAQNAWSMLLEEMTLVSSSWSCFFGLEEWLEVRLDDERRTGAFAEVAEGELTPFPRLGHHEDLTPALHPTTIALVQVIDVFALEVTQALLTPVEMVPICGFDVGHERGEVLDPRVVSIVCLVCDSCSSQIGRASCRERV